MTTFLVTGGAGFIGSSIAEALLAKGEHVRILDDFSTGRRSNVEALKGKLEVIEGTIVDEATVKRAMQGVEVVFHEAAIPSRGALGREPAGVDARERPGHDGRARRRAARRA